MEQLLIINSILLWIGLLFNLLLSLALIRRTAKNFIGQRNEETLKPGEIAPAFQAESLRDGNIVNQDTYKGRDVGFVIIGADCQPCHDFLPHILEIIPLVEQYDIDLILVSDSDKFLTGDFLKKFNFNIDLPIIIADRKDNRFLENYKVLGTPWYCLVDRKGIVRGAGYPGSNAEVLRKHIIDIVA